MKTQWLILMSLLMGINSFAQAGNGAGNGGLAVVCREDGKITSARLLDLLEGEFRDGFHYTRDSRSASEMALIRYGFYGKESTFIYTSLNMLTPKNAHFISYGFGLPDPKDFTPRITLKEKNCRFEVVALYDDSQGTLSVDQEIYGQLPKFDQMALFWHETLYLKARKFGGAICSDRVRQNVAYLLSNEGDLKDETLYGDLAAGALSQICYVRYSNYDRLQVDGVEIKNSSFLMKKNKTVVEVGKVKLEFRRLPDHRIYVTQMDRKNDAIKAKFSLFVTGEAETEFAYLYFDSESLVIGCMYRDGPVDRF